MKMGISSGKRVLVRALAILVLLPLAACGATAAPAATSGTAAPIVITRGSSASASQVVRQEGPVIPIAAEQGPSTGLRLRLSEGSEQAASVEPPAPVPPAQPIDDAAVSKLLARLPALPTPPSDYQEFALPAESLPAPRTGLTIQEPFPPPATPPPPEQKPAGQLEVLRYAPEGDVSLAPYLSVTFNQPMVPLTGLQDLAAVDVPVRLSPTPPGEWRWVGTRTLEFHPKGRFPMATTYTAEVPAGTQSAVGGTLDAAVRWTFATPPPNLISSFPGGSPQPLDPLLFAAFDQRIEPQAVLDTVKVSAGGKPVPIRLATSDGVSEDEAVKRLASDAGEGRWLAFRAAEPFPPDTQVTVVIGPGTPSAEGSLTTAAPQSFGFSTYGPLRVVDHGCGWGGNCPPLAPWFVAFSNPLDEAAFRESNITITPELSGANVNVSGTALQIQGVSSGRTTYQVVLSKEIRDRFGQTLGQDVRLAFDVGSAEPVFWTAGGNFVALDPTANRPAYSVFTINYDRLKAEAYAVEPKDWAAFKAYLMAYYSDKPVDPPGRRVFSKTIDVQGGTDELVETAIDLSPALSDGLGQVVLIVQPEGSLLQRVLPMGQRPPTAQAWIQSTQIGLDAFSDADRLVAWTNSLADGAPLNGVEVSLVGQNAALVAKTTDDAGIAILPLPDDKASLLVARKGGDLAILPADVGPWGDSGWARSSPFDRLRWYVFDDRGIYRPGEEVHVKGWIRRIGAGPEGDVGPLMGAAELVRYRLMDSRGNEILNGSSELNALGGFTMAFTLTETMNLGPAGLELSALGGSGGVDNPQEYHTFQVQEFRRPEFEVKTSASEGPHMVGDSATVEVSATYYAGGGLPDAEVTWNVRQSPAQYSPPGWDDFTFGTWVPWWGRGYASVSSIEFGQFGPRGPAETFTGRTDAAGVHRLQLDFESVDPPQPTSVTAEATVMDVNRQAWSSAAVLLVHPAELYVGLRTDRIFVERDQPLRVDAIVTDLDGNAVPGREIRMQAARLEWKSVNGTWQEVEAVVQPCTVQSAKEPVTCTFETPEGGTYRITATVTDEQGRANRSELTRWVTGGSLPPSRRVEQEQVNLIPDRKEYQPGDTAEILVLSPFSPAEGVVTLRRSGLVSSERFTMDGPSTTIKVPIRDVYIPNLHVQVDLVGSAPRTDDNGKVVVELPPRPAYASGEINLPIPPWQRALSLEVTPRESKIEPGGETAIDVVVRDAAGVPVPGAELAAVVVDEAVLALTGYQIADPMGVFYTDRSPDVSDYHLRASLLLARPEDLLTSGAGQAADTLGLEKQAVREAAMAPAPMATEAPAAPASGMTGENAPAIALRTDFNPLAAFVPTVFTDAEGRAEVPVKLPDNLTRYRVTIVAVTGEDSKLAGKQFGMGESAITARLPLMVRPSPPRFLNFGDRFELPVVLQNQTDAPMQVDVAVRAANAVLTAGAGRQVTVPANDRVEVRFPVTTASAGTARFQVVAAQTLSPAVSDAAQFELPVWTPATTEAFAVYGTVDSGGVSQPVTAPANVYSQFGGLEITTSSTALQELTDAVLYLVSYPFECSEQLASRILGVASLRDVLSAFQAEGLPAPAEMEAAVARDVTRLAGMQNADGGFPIWRRGQPSWPYNSIHVANALQRAKLKGYEVPEGMLDQANGYLRQIEDHIPADWGPDVRNTLIAYALNVRNQMGDPDPARARRLVNEVGLEKLSPEAIGWILPVLSDDPGSVAARPGSAERAGETEAIRRNLLNRVTETAGAAHFAASYGDGAYLLLYSDRRADGIILEALIGDQPQSDLIPKLVRGLLSGRKAGHWANTQEDVFILLALDRYFHAYEAETPDFVARIWLGDRYAGEAEFRGRTTDYRQTDVPMSVLAEQTGAQNLILTKEGPGRLYYRMGLQYAPTDLQMPPLDRGFTVERSYEGVDDPADVSRDATGAWHVKAGARVRVVLTMVAPARRYHVALVDPLPAGLEALNPELVVTGDLPPGPAESSSQRWWWPWYEHQNLRDERAEAFSTLLWEGVYTYSYVTRATTPGQFVVPPAKAEEMYAPETFGRSASDRVIVE
jgi:uncharacterized protein YfaS (alpha-2-macroglobulin family)